ncbi:MAG: hypothetical protein H6738_02610 [Alphaproteobacteria bacterium]|nr:hypothetical protein [Alphaproteobacteria bacterium]MCB9695661.1 hypothetical protein [Alphaproteobacteria bacterium]
MDERAIARRLAAIPEVAEHPGLADVGGAAFSFASVLLDDDENLTRMGNPTGEARERLRARILELLASMGSALDEVALDEEGP